MPSADAIVPGAPVIALRDVHRTYRLAGGPVPAVRGVSLEVAAGEWVAITGPSGCGKSTLLHLIGAVDTADAGTIHVAGHDLARLDDRARTRLRLTTIGFVFQRFHLMPMLSALENVLLPIVERDGRDRRAARECARELLAYVGLDARRDHRPAQLSGGEQQRVAIARALANRPALVLADEPTGELDAATGRGIVDLFARLATDGTTLLVVTHDDAVARAARRVVRLRDGRVVPEGAA